jgi:hypothetical protein
VSISPAKVNSQYKNENMKILLRPLIAILTLTFSLIILHMVKIFFVEDETTIHIAQISSCYENYSGDIVTFFHPDEFPSLVNSTEALEVTGLAKSAEHYHLRLKNNSGKNVVAYFLAFGNRGIDHEESNGHRGTLIAPGDTYQEDHLSAKSLESTITIHTVVFDDDTFEGDLNLAAQIVARREGIRIQSVPVLQMIDHTLEVNDANLPEAFDRLQTQLGAIPEAIDKASTIALLRSKYPCFDKRMIGQLYEYFKMGLYEGKNMAYCRVCNMQYYLKDLKEDSTVSKEAVQSTLIRERLNEIKQKLKGVSKTRDNRM